jgi:hypothetical protein
MDHVLRRFMIVLHDAHDAFHICTASFNDTPSVFAALPRNPKGAPTIRSVAVHVNGSKLQKAHATGVLEPHRRGT